MFQLFIRCLMLFVFVSCGSSKLDVDFHSPTVRFQTPETTGKTLGLRGQAGFGSSHKVSMARTRQTKDLINNTPSAIVFDRNVEYSVSNEFGYGVDVGILSRLDFIFSKRSESHYRFGGKFQFFGKPGGVENGLKLAVMGTYGYKKERDVSKAGIFDKAEDFDTVTGNSTLKSTDYGGLIGYRASPQFLVYVLGFQDENKVHSTISVQTQSDINLENEFKTRGINLGAEILQAAQGDVAVKGLFLNLEGGLSEIENREGLKARHRTYGLAAGARF
ncbi:MAG: hypothetical protein A2X86_13500 [Bdellovibrionales bacterium GWA2_49_15]|nr:MAG: hypothetical protein A2X86_13500 [Bdellovibrionales bacterium GWA2_49_15]HAZ13541.1 hypothetical protein [Bdellovibrionales bacterium]